MKNKFGLYASGIGLLLGVCAFFPSCEEDEGYTNNEMDEVPQKTTVSQTIGKETAKKDALKAANAFFATDETPRKIESVSALLGGDNLKDTIAYACNFKDNAGFAIIAADSRLADRVIVCAEEGRFDEHSDNPGFSMLLDNIKNYTERKIAENAGKTTKSGNRLKSQTDGDSIISLGFNQVGPLIKTAWGQGDPYNALLDTCPESNSPYPAGCVCTATMQLIAYYNHPGVEMMPEMTAKRHAQELDDFHKGWVGILYKCFWRDVKPTSMKCSGVGFSLSDAQKMLEEYGHQSEGLKDFEIQTILKNVGNHHPVFTRGERTGGSHAWLVDGYRTERFCYASDQANELEGETYFHVNWGWEGLCDGWFAAGCFDVDAAVEYDQYHKNRNRNYMKDIMTAVSWPKQQAEYQELNTENLEEQVTE